MKVRTISNVLRIHFSVLSILSRCRLSDAYGCLGVLSVNGGNAAESNFYLVMITGASNVGKVLDVEV